MPAYHSKFNELEGVRSIGGISILPIKATASKGVATLANDDEKDVIDETLEYFRANMLFSTFDIKGDADRMLIYMTAFASECIKKLAKEKVDNKEAGIKNLHSLSISKFQLPGDSNFLPGLGQFFEKPSSKSNADFLKQYLSQCRTEMAARLAERIFNEDGTPNKWWFSYSKKSFMGSK
jgi:actin related protein 2/3 complex subunit 3|tara:strand:- start:5 stop:541 length:537 start_codon:yes stop_codon:yes gene_type:complete